MKKSLLLTLLLVLSLVFSIFAQTPLISTSKLILIDTAGSYNGIYRGWQKAICFEPVTGNLVLAWRNYISGDPDPRRVYAAVSLDVGNTWTIYPDINFGVGSKMNAYQPSVMANETTPIIIYRNANAENIQWQPVIATDIIGWGGGVFENNYVDEIASSDTVMDMRYPNLDIAPDNPNLWFVAAHHHASDAPGEFHCIYRSTDGGATWSRPKVVVTAIDGDAEKSNYIRDLSTTGVGVIASLNNKVYLVGVCRKWSSPDDPLWRIYWEVSDDGGVTWSDPAMIPGTETLNFSNGDLSRVVTPICDASGNLHVFAIGDDTTKWTSSDPKPFRGYHFKYDGSTWSSGQIIASPQLLEDGFITGSVSRTINDPCIGADGTIYYAYSDIVDTTGSAGSLSKCKHNIFVVLSTDGGGTWSSPVAVLTDWNGRDPNGLARKANENLHFCFRQYFPDEDPAYSNLYYLSVPADSVKARAATSVENYELANVTKEFQLNQNYPNPFNPSTNISYELLKSSHVTLKVFNVVGEEIATLIDKKLEPGHHEINWKATDITAGVYFINYLQAIKQQ